MPLEATILERADHARFDDLCASSPHGSVFSTTTWADHLASGYEVIGAFKGREMVGGGVVHVSGGGVSRYTPYTPWVGLVGRSSREGECAEIAEAVVDNLLGRYGEVTLTLSPEWTDIRPFTWRGMRAHVRYTYRGRGNTGYERRLSLHDCIVKREMTHDGGLWQVHEFTTGDSVVIVIFDWFNVYYWKANKGGHYHADLLNTAIKAADSLGLGFDLVGANSPNRSLFKRAFGGALTPYYAVTTSNAIDLREDNARRTDLRQVSARAEIARACGV